MSVLELYLLTRLDSFGSLLTFLFSITGFLTFIVLCVGPPFLRDFFPDMKNPVKKIVLVGTMFFGLSLFMAFCRVLIPTKSDMALIYSGHFLTNNENAKKLPDKILKKLNVLLDNIEENE